MKILKNLLLLVLITISAKGMAQRFATAIELNDYLVSTTDSLYKAGTDWGTTMADVHESKKYYLLVEPRKKIENFISRKLNEFNSMQDQFGSEGLRKAMISFLYVEKGMIENSFKPFEKLNSSSSDTDIDAQIKALTKDSEKEDVELKKVNKAQAEFAEKNGFKIEETKEEK